MNIFENLNLNKNSSLLAKLYKDSIVVDPNTVIKICLQKQLKFVLIYNGTQNNFTLLYFKQNE